MANCQQRRLPPSLVIQLCLCGVGIVMLLPLVPLHTYTAVAVAAVLMGFVQNDIWDRVETSMLRANLH
jgi:hypothetical protein